MDPRPARRFYGRRKGKKLHAARADALETVLPAIRTGLPLPAAPQDLFPFPVRGLWLEIGFGNGENLVHFARNNPDTGYIGCEPFENGIAALCKSVREHDIKNIRVFPDDAHLLLDALPDGCLDGCFLLNADPWPKKRHHKRRFIQKETLDTLHRVLKPGARLRMTTDHPGLAQWEFDKTFFHGGFAWTAQCAADWKTRPADMTQTRYQQKNLAEHPVTFLEFRRV